MRNIIQAAGVKGVPEGRMLAACGITHVGLPLRLPVHAPDVSEDEARGIVEALQGLCETVCITYLESAAETLALCLFLGVTGVQLHGPMPLSELRALRKNAPGLFIIKSLVVGAGTESELLALARAQASYVDAFLTDTFDPASGASGATGKVHDWQVSRRLAKALATELAKPLILAGGLNPGNVGAAIRAVRPFGVDAHTGLENAAGGKDQALVERFVAEARAAWAALGDSGGLAGLAKARDSA